MSDWYEALKNIQSRGSQAQRPGSLAGLAAARRVHLGQFFTPDALARAIWRIVEPVMDKALMRDHNTAVRNNRISILDNSVGSARLLQYAHPEKHELFGVDVDTELLAEVGKVAQAAGFHCEFESCGMEALRASSFDVGLINPPFSVHLEAATLEPFDCTTYGKYGPHTSAVSHAYALAQAVEACQIVVALLPTTFAEEVVMDPEAVLGFKNVRKLRALINLPNGVFREENTDVSVSLLVFGERSGPYERYFLSNLEEALPDLGLILHGEGGDTRFRVQGVEDGNPSITLPVTGDNTVRVTHNGRRIGLRFYCGLTQAKVQNAVLIARVRAEMPARQRLPRGVNFSGMGALDVEVHLAQDKPIESFESLITTIREAGGEPQVDPGLLGFLRRRIRRTERQKTPLAHTVWMPSGVPDDAKKVIGRSRKQQVADPQVWLSPVIQMGEKVHLTREDDGNYIFAHHGKIYQLSQDSLHERFDVTECASEPGWVQIYPGLLKMFPDIAQSYRQRALALGLNKWLTWGFQFDDAIEMSMCPDGAICSWVMGLGKARLAIALIMLNGCKRGLVVTEAGLVDEMVTELKGLPIPKTDWQVITKPEHLQTLPRISVIAYERLRLPVDHTRPRMTYGKSLRHRIGLLVADEGDVLANPDSGQCRALAVVAPKKRYLLSGTLIANYPRDTLPVLAHTVGDCTASQPWGWRGGYLEPEWRQSMNNARRGTDAFRDTFVHLEWVTKEFSDTLLEGAKREIPRIKNLTLYRQMLAPHVKRRVILEPEVAKHIHIPIPTREIVEVLWDPGHLSFYLEIAEDFASWYRIHMRDIRQRNSLITLLAHIRAVCFACDYPQHGVQGFGSYTQLTSKHRWAIEELERLAKDDHKIILYAENPGVLEMLGSKLTERGIGNVVFHGGRTIKRRTKELNERFRFGNCPVLLASLGVTQKGLNLYQADEVILLSRSWSATVEEQAIARLLRPQQKRNVRVRYLHLPGSIDCYKTMLVDFKRDAAHAGMDWATPETDSEEFLHLTTVINRFVEGLAKFKNVDRSQLRDVLKQEAAYA